MYAGDRSMPVYSRLRGAVHSPPLGHDRSPPSRRAGERRLVATPRVTPRRALKWLLTLAAGALLLWVWLGRGDDDRRIAIFDTPPPADSSDTGAARVCGAARDCTWLRSGHYDRASLAQLGVAGAFASVLVQDGYVLQLGVDAQNPLMAVTFADGEHACDAPACRGASWVQVAPLDDFAMYDADEVTTLCDVADGTCAVLASTQSHALRPNADWTATVPPSLLLFVLRGSAVAAVLSSGTHTCRAGVDLFCKDASSVRVAAVADALHSIAYVASLAESRRLPEHILADPLRLTLPAPTRFPPTSTALVTQITVSRLERFTRLAATWRGPVSVAVYLQNPWDAVTLARFLLAPPPTDRPLLDHVTWTVVQPDYRRDFRLYPINALRNAALDAAQDAEYVFVVDADFMPDDGLYDAVQRVAVAEMRARPDEKLAFVVASPALRREAPDQRPSDIGALRRLFRDGWAYITALIGHATTKYGIFFSAPLVARSQPFYEVCFESQWEPYYVLHRSAPRYDERFRNQGGDKQSHALLLNAMGYRFFVLHDHFLYHLDHEPGMSWPGGGLRVGGSASTFNYFSDYSPEIEEAYGRYHRRPKCAATAAWADTLPFGA